MKLVSSEVTEDAAVGQSQRFCVIKPQVCVQKYEYFMYDPKGSSPYCVRVFLIGRYRRKIQTVHGVLHV